MIKKLKIEKYFLFKDTILPISQELANIYQAADLFIMASFFEVQSIATLEAMASGLPIVASNFSALPELVKDGVNGFLFKKGDFNDLGEKILKIIENPKLCQKMGEESRCLALAHNLTITSKKYENIYKDILIKN